MYPYLLLMISTFPVLKHLNRILILVARWIICKVFIRYLVGATRSPDLPYRTRISSIESPLERISLIKGTAFHFIVTLIPLSVGICNLCMPLWDQSVHINCIFPIQVLFVCCHFNGLRFARLGKFAPPHCSISRIRHFLSFWAFNSSFNRYCNEKCFEIYSACICDDCSPFRTELRWKCGLTK